MALFGEKYGDVVRMVEVGDGELVARAVRRHARALDGGDRRLQDHAGDLVSAANVRRIEAITGPLGVELLRKHDRVLHDAAVALRTQPDAVADVAAARGRQAARAREAAARPARRGGRRTPADDDRRDRRRPRGVRDPRGRRTRRRCRTWRTACKNQLGDPAVVVLGAPGEGRASLLVAVDARRGRARREGRRGRQGRGGGGRRRRRRARHHGPGRRPGPGQAAGRAGRRARGDRARARAVEGRRARLRLGALRRRGQRSDRDARHAARAGAAARRPRRASRR